jgi:23S rRNA pseudouridine1911/1915/1917 synthase
MNEELNERHEFYEHYRFIADQGQSPLRIDKYLVNRIENLSRTRIQCAAVAGNILVNEKAVKSNYRVKPGDVISIVTTYPPREIDILPENIPLDIVFEDDDLIVINKPQGMVVHPGHGNYSGTLVNALTYYLKDLTLFRSGEIRPGLVHRIDKHTSGILVIAKTELAHNNLAKQFFDHSVDRKYMALVWGNLQENEGTITGNIGRNPKDRTRMYVFPDGTQGKPALTHYKVIESLGYVSLVECKLETGRTHQIRVHFQYIKHPVFNDNEYGGDIILKGSTFSKYKQFVQNCFKILPGQALHAKSLSFTHPRTNERIFFDTDIPDDMEQVIEKWRNYSRKN